MKAPLLLSSFALLVFLAGCGGGSSGGSGSDDDEDEDAGYSESVSTTEYPDMAGCNSTPPTKGTVREYTTAGWMTENAANEPSVNTAQKGQADLVAFAGTDWAAEVAGYREAWEQVVGPVPHTNLCLEGQDEDLDVTSAGVEWLEEIRGYEQVQYPTLYEDLNVTLRNNRLETDRYVMKKVSYQGEHGQRIPAYLFLPKGYNTSRPAVVVPHQAVYGCGKKEPAGVCVMEADDCPAPYCPHEGAYNLDFAADLATRGYVVLAPDSAGFGERHTDTAESGNYGHEIEETEDLLAYFDDKVTQEGLRISDNMRAIDFLQQLPEVDDDRIGMVGHSNGSIESIMTASIDERVLATVANGGPNAFRRIKVIEAMCADPDADYSTLPSFLKTGFVDYGWFRNLAFFTDDVSEIPVDIHQVYATMASRNLYVMLIEDDTTSFAFDRVDTMFTEAERAFDALGGSFKSYKVSSGLNDLIDDGSGNMVACRETTTCPWNACRYDHGWYLDRYEEDAYDWLGDILEPATLASMVASRDDDK